MTILLTRSGAKKRLPLWANQLLRSRKIAFYGPRLPSPTPLFVHVCRGETTPTKLWVERAENNAFSKKIE